MVESSDLQSIAPGEDWAYAIRLGNQLICYLHLRKFCNSIAMAARQGILCRHEASWRSCRWPSLDSETRSNDTARARVSAPEAVADRRFQLHRRWPGLRVHKGGRERSGLLEWPCVTNRSAREGYS
jgi:hypothetical protein